MAIFIQNLSLFIVFLLVAILGDNPYITVTSGLFFSWLVWFLSKEF